MVSLIKNLSSIKAVKSGYINQKRAYFFAYSGRVDIDLDLVLFHFTSENV